MDIDKNLQSDVRCFNFIKEEVGKVNFGKVILELTIKNRKMVNLKMIKQEKNFNIN